MLARYMNLPEQIDNPNREENILKGIILKLQLFKLTFFHCFFKFLSKIKNKTMHDEKHGYKQLESIIYPISVPLTLQHFYSSSFLSKA